MPLFIIIFVLAYKHGSIFIFKGWRFLYLIIIIGFCITLHRFLQGRNQLIYLFSDQPGS